MNFFQWLTTKRKTLGTMSVAELRAQEMLVGAECKRMQAKVGQLAKEKQKIVEQGAAEKTPEMRGTLAQGYDLKHTEQMMLSRHLNIRTKELLTVSRLRILRESADRSRAGSSIMGRIRDSDLALIERLIESDTISTEMYQERLDEILHIGTQADEASAAVSPAAGELMQVWDDMDAGLIKNSEEAFDEAEKRVRERERGKATE